MALRRTIVAGGKTGRSNARSIEAILTDYKAFAGRVNSVAKDTLQEVANLVLDHTKPFVPVQYGGLLESGRAFVEQTEKGFAAKVTFGGDDAQVSPTPNAPSGIVDYAVLVHEDLERSSSPKFLERGALEAAEEANALVIDRLKAVKP